MYANHTQNSNQSAIYTSNFGTDVSNMCVWKWHIVSLGIYV